MKTLFPSFITVSCAVTVFFACGQAPKGNDSRGHAAGKSCASAEETLPLSGTILSDQAAQRLIDNWTSYFKTDLGDASTGIADSLDSAAISDFHKIAFDMAVAECKGNFITCIKITYGIDTVSGTDVFLYTPLYALRGADSIQDHETWMVYNVQNNNTYYTYANGKFTAATDVSAIGRYCRHIRIDHKKNSVYAKIDSLNDSQAAIYPFQELTELMAENGDSPKVKFVNTATQDAVPQHSLLMGPADLDRALRGQIKVKVIVMGGVNKSTRDLAHLCPPNCGRLAFLQ